MHNDVNAYSECGSEIDRSNGENCSNCKFGFFPAYSCDKAVCLRYPVPSQCADKNHWCGEYSAKETPLGTRFCRFCNGILNNAPHECKADAEFSRIVKDWKENNPERFK